MKFNSLPPLLSKSPQLYDARARSCTRSLLVLLVLCTLFGLQGVRGDTVVHIGEIREFNGPDDLELDPNRVVVAIDVFGDADRVVNDVLFQTDRSAPAGVTVTASNSINDWTTRPSYSGADPASVDNLEQIMQDIRWEAAPAPVAVTVTGLTPGIEYELQMLFNEGADRDRRWDIGIEGELAVDDFSSEGDGAWSPSNGFAYIAPFTLAPGDTTLNVEMKQHIGGQAARGSDNNPILQAFTITEVTVPPAPDGLTLLQDLLLRGADRCDRGLCNDGREAQCQPRVFTRGRRSGQRQVRDRRGHDRAGPARLLGARSGNDLHGARAHDRRRRSGPFPGGRTSCSLCGRHSRRPVSRSR